MRIQGEVEPGFEPVEDALVSVVRRGGGAAICVYHKGHKVVDIWGGYRDAEGNRWKADTMAMSFSTSKGVMATLLHRLVDQGRLDYEDPVARHWPEFAQGGKGEITVRQVLSHRAGLPHLTPLVEHAEQILDWDHMVGALARKEPGLRPGGRSAYHALTFGWLVGEIAQRVTGKRIPELLRTELAEPLGLDGLYIGAPPEAKARAATLQQPRRAPGPLPGLMQQLGIDSWLETFSGLSRAARLPIDPALMRDALMIPGSPGILFTPQVLDVPIPAANGLFTARSLARMYAALAAGGSLDGVRVLSPETLRRASEIQVRGPDRVLMLPMHWRLGWHSAFTRRGRIQTAFGHFGYGGSGGFADPKRELGVALINNSTGGTPLGDTRIGRVADAALLAARAVRERHAALPKRAGGTS